MEFLGVSDVAESDLFEGVLAGVLGEVEFDLISQGGDLASDCVLRFEDSFVDFFEEEVCFFVHRRFCKL